MPESVEFRMLMRDETRPALESARLSAETMSGAAARLWKELNTVDGKMATFGQQAKNLQQKLGPASAAISGVSAALGENAGQAGKAVAAAGQLTAAFGSGGPLGLAIAGMTLLVGQLQKSWDDEILAQDKAIAATYAGASKAGALRAKADAEVAALRKTLGGPETGAQASARVQQEIEGVQRQRQSLIETRNALKVGTEGYDDARANLESERKILEGVIRTLQVKQGLEFQAAASRGAKTAGPAKAAESTRGTNYDSLDAGDVALAQEAQARRQRQADDLAFAFELADDDRALELEATKEHAKAIADAEKESARERLDQQKDLAAARLDVERAANSMLIGLGQSAASTLIATSQDYLAMKIEGEKNAEAIATANFLKGIGNQLVGVGLRGVFEGAVISANPLTPGAGAGMIGTGLAAIAVGVGMGAGGAAIGKASGGRGGSGDDARRDPGARSGGGSSGGRAPSGAPVGITIIYDGASGPTAEQGGKAVLGALRLVGRRQGGGGIHGHRGIRR